VIPGRSAKRKTAAWFGLQTAVQGYTLPALAEDGYRRLPLRRIPAPCGRGNTFLMVRGFAGRVKPDGQVSGPEGIAKGTLLFGDPEIGDPKTRIAGSLRRKSEFSPCWFANIRQKTRMGSAACGVVVAGFVQAQGSIHGEANVGGILIFLPVILPPAHRAQGQRRWRLQRPESAARATKTSLHHYSPFGLTANRG